MTRSLPAPSRRRLMRAALTLLAAGGLGQVGAQAEPRRITLVARRFRYEPAEIALKVGEPVVIEITALDFAHGLKIPDLHQRLDLLPGLITRLALQPRQPGTIDFLCDNFCGEDHEDMHGRFIVSA